MKSPSQHKFSQAPSVRAQRSAFMVRHGHKTTISENYLYPIFVDEVLPGDTFKHKTTIFCRLQPGLQYPIMDNIYFDMLFFYCPYRIIWPKWEAFIGAVDDDVTTQENPSTDYVTPKIDSYKSGTTVGFDYDSPHAYMGVRPKIDNIIVSNLNGRAYNKTYNDWFRDQNLQNEVDVYDPAYPDGPDDKEKYPLLMSNKKYDYFTSCLTYPQWGPGVAVIAQGTAPVIGDGKGLGLTEGSHSFGIYTYNAGIGASDTYYADDAYGADVGDASSGFASYTADKVVGVTDDPDNSGLVASMEDATLGILLNDLREAAAIQQLLEADMRGGRRYNELIYQHFQVIIPDSRLQRVEFLGSFTFHVNINPVAHTANESGGSGKVGQLAAYAVGVGNGGYVKSFVEHGVILGIARVRSDMTYQQGVNAMWYRSTRFDFMWPELCHLGEQPVYNREIFAKGDSSDTDVFGYLPIYDSYRYKPNLVTGQLNSDYTAPLDAYHFAYDYADTPVLDGSWIQEDSPINRVVQVTTQDHFLVDSLHEITKIRRMPMYGIPGLGRI